MFTTFENLDPESRILLFGCGGGYDIFCGLPLYFRLVERYKSVFLGNFSFTKLDLLTQFPKYCEGWYLVNDNIKLTDYKYAPEYDLARQLKVPVYTYTDTGLKNLEHGFRSLVHDLSLDIIILCDGGCDSIITGWEFQLATPVEDFMSLMAVQRCDVKGYLMLLGATVDTFVEMKRLDFLANLDDLSESLLESRLLSLDSYTSRYITLYCQSHPQNSIVNASIVARLQGYTGSVVPPLIQNRCLEGPFVLDDYLITAYLFDIQVIIKRTNFIKVIQDLDDSDDIDSMLMACHDHIYDLVTDYNMDLSYRDNKLPKVIPDFIHQGQRIVFKEGSFTPYNI